MNVESGSMLPSLFSGIMSLNAKKLGYLAHWPKFLHYAYQLPSVEKVTTQNRKIAFLPYYIHLMTNE